MIIDMKQQGDCIYLRVELRPGKGLTLCFQPEATLNEVMEFFDNFDLKNKISEAKK